MQLTKQLQLGMNLEVKFLYLVNDHEICLNTLEASKQLFVFFLSFHHIVLQTLKQIFFEF